MTSRESQLHNYVFFSYILGVFGGPCVGLGVLFVFIFVENPAVLQGVCRSRFLTVRPICLLFLSSIKYLYRLYQNKIKKFFILKYRKINLYL